MVYSVEIQNRRQDGATMQEIFKILAQLEDKYTRRKWCVWKKYIQKHAHNNLYLPR
jgi:hypothetical protein